MAWNFIVDCSHRPMSINIFKFEFQFTFGISGTNWRWQETVPNPSVDWSGVPDHWHWLGHSCSRHSAVVIRSVICCFSTHIPAVNVRGNVFVFVRMCVCVCVWGGGVLTFIKAGTHTCMQICMCVWFLGYLSVCREGGEGSRLEMTLDRETVTY